MAWDCADDDGIFCTTHVKTAAENIAAKGYTVTPLYHHPAPAAGVKAPFAVFGQEAIDAAMENERTAQQFRDDLVASPSPPALDGAGRDAVIEECAKVAEEFDARTPLAKKLGAEPEWHRKLPPAIAAAIRSLKETP